MIIPIESRSNEKIKSAVKLASSSRYRSENREFFLEGLRLCYDAYLSSVEIKQFFFTENARQKNPEKINDIISSAAYSYTISEDISSKLSLTQNGQGIYAVCAMPDKNGKPIKKGGKYIAFENIQDPANLGAMARTAEALGIDGAIISGCCDCYNPKAQRAAMGSLMRLETVLCDNLPVFLAERKKEGFELLATTPSENSQRITDISFEGGVICVIGNEGNGVSSETMDLCRRVTIPMKGRAESLNASMAAAIVMWEMMR